VINNHLGASVSEPEEEDFAAMFEASERARRVSKGQIIDGTIVAIGEESALVDVGGKSEAAIDIAELKDDEGRVEVKVGDRIKAMVVSTAGGLTLSRRLALGAATAAQLEDAFHSRLPVEGKVAGAVKGGYEVRVARQRAFCPFSQIDVRGGPPQGGPHEGDPHLGRVYKFRIIEYKEGGRNIIVSRRALLEEEQQANAAEVRKSIVEGAIVTGRIVSVRDFGAFVDIGGGVQGLLHVSEMAWERVPDARQFVKSGDEIAVKVLRVDADKQRISLGLKQLAADPWSRAAETYKAGQLRRGRVTRVADFGPFVELEPGVEGLVPLSESGVPREADVKKAFRVGDELQVVVLDVDPAARRIRLSVSGVQTMREADEMREYTKRTDGAAPEKLGSLADKLRDALNKRS
jgi:small subunit ribosomal protein S1